MARVIEGARNHLYDDLALLKKRRLRTAGVTMLGFLLFLGGPVTGKPTVSLVGLVVALVAYMVNRKIYEAVEVIQAGIVGEENAGIVFSGLPDEYTIYSDLSIEIDGKMSQLDHVVVGPSGIFVIETKNMTGEIQGDLEDHEWKQIKLSRQKVVYERTFYNPVKQVGTHVYRLSQLLKSAHIHAWVQGIVYFSHPDVTIHATGTKIPVFSISRDGEDGIRNFILTFSRKNVEGDTIEQIEHVLKDVIQTS